MKKNVFLLSLMAFALFSCATASETIIPSKNYVIKKVKTDKFDGISAAASIDVVYTQTSGVQDIEVYAPDNLMEYVKIDVEKGILKVKFESKETPDKGLNIRGEHQTVVRVSALAIHALSASSSGDIVLKNGLQTTGLVTLKSSSSGDIEGGDVVCDELVVMASSSGDVALDKVECKSLETDASSSGDVEMESVACVSLDIDVSSSGGLEINHLKAETVEADASSAGEIKLAGTCRSARFGSSSSGDIEAEDLKADKVIAKTSSAGDITCYPVESLEASVSSGGNIGYKGNPKHIDFHSKHGLKKID